MDRPCREQLWCSSPWRGHQGWGWARVCQGVRAHERRHVDSRCSETRNNECKTVTEGKGARRQVALLPAGAFAWSLPQGAWHGACAAMHVNAHTLALAHMQHAPVSRASTPALLACTSCPSQHDDARHERYRLQLRSERGLRECVQAAQELEADS